jgi:hypothetical protein
MLCRFAVLLALIPLLLISVIQTGPSPGCCPAGRDGQPVVNADQTVVMIWDAEKKVQHFIRQATFRSEDTDVGFLVPTPSVPELEESGNDAFPLLAQFTAPEIKYLAKPPARGGGGCGCGGVDPDLEARNAPAAGVVQVLAQKQVAGFDAQVLAATTSESLVEWLNAHGYSFSPEVATWAEPYIRDGWKITALQVARRAGETADGAKPVEQIAASALRISFATDRPLFPYREPNPEAAAKQLNARRRMLRIFFVADGRFQGDLTQEQPWTGRVAWADKLQPTDRAALLEKLKLPADTGPTEFWLTEFEDYWPYRAAPADLYFARDANQAVLHRDPIIRYVSVPARQDITLALLFAACLGPWLWSRRTRSRRTNG